MNDYQTILSIGEHNSTYTVSSTKEGLEFKKTRLNHPVKNAKASFQKVKLRKKINISMLTNVLTMKIPRLRLYLKNMYQILFMDHYMYMRRYLLIFDNMYIDILQILMQYLLFLLVFTPLVLNSDKHIVKRSIEVAEESVSFHP